MILDKEYTKKIINKILLLNEMHLNFNHKKSLLKSHFLIANKIVNEYILIEQDFYWINITNLAQKLEIDKTMLSRFCGYLDIYFKQLRHIIDSYHFYKSDKYLNIVNW